MHGFSFFEGNGDNAERGVGASKAVLAAVEAAVADLEPYAQKDAKKGMSRPVTGLISTAQSGGDLRGLLKRVDKALGTRRLDEYFDPATNHAFAAGPPNAKKAAA